MAKTLIIEDSSPEAKKLLAYIRTLPYVTVMDTQKKAFSEECRFGKCIYTGTASSN